MNANPLLSALALLVRKFGTKIPGGGYEVEISHLEMKEMSPHGMFQEVPELDKHLVKWQYFPNHTIEGTPISVTPDGVTSPSPASLRPTCGHKSTNQYSTNRCNRPESHEGDHSYGDSYETSEYWVNTESVDPAYLQDKMTEEQKKAYLEHLNSGESDDGATT